MCSTKHKWVTLGSSIHNLVCHFIYDTNHVHRIQPLPFTLLPTVGPVSVSSTCCPFLETGSLRWMKMVKHAFIMLFGVVVSQWWGTSWTSVDLTSAWELQWVSIHHMHTYVHDRFINNTKCIYTHACAHTHSRTSLCTLRVDACYAVIYTNLLSIQCYCIWAFHTTHWLAQCANAVNCVTCISIFMCSCAIPCVVLRMICVARQTHSCVCMHAHTIIQECMQTTSSKIVLCPLPSTNMHCYNSKHHTVSCCTHTCSPTVHHPNI